MSAAVPPTVTPGLASTSGSGSDASYIIPIVLLGCALLFFLGCLFAAISAACRVRPLYSKMPFRRSLHRFHRRLFRNTPELPREQRSSTIKSASNASTCFHLTCPPCVAPEAVANFVAAPSCRTCADACVASSCCGVHCCQLLCCCATTAPDGASDATESDCSCSDAELSSAAQTMGNKKESVVSRAPTWPAGCVVFQPPAMPQTVVAPTLSNGATIRDTKVVDSRADSSPRSGGGPPPVKVKVRNSAGILGGDGGFYQQNLRSSEDPISAVISLAPPSVKTSSALPVCPPRPPAMSYQPSPSAQTGESAKTPPTEGSAEENASPAPNHVQVSLAEVHDASGSLVEAQNMPREARKRIPTSDRSYSEQARDLIAKKINAKATNNALIEDEAIPKQFSYVPPVERRSSVTSEHGRSEKPTEAEPVVPPVERRSSVTSEHGRSEKPVQRNRSADGEDVMAALLGSSAY